MGRKFLQEGEIYTGGEKRREFGGNKRKKTLNLNWFLSRRLPPSLGKNQKWPSPTFAKKNQKHRGAVPSSSGFLHGPAKAPHLTPSSEPQKRPDPSPPKKPNRPFLQPPAPLATTATKSQELPSLVFPHRPPHNSSSRQLPWPHLPKKSKPLPFSGLSPTRKTSQDNPRSRHLIQPVGSRLSSRRPAFHCSGDTATPPACRPDGNPKTSSLLVPPPAT